MFAFKKVIKFEDGSSGVVNAKDSAILSFWVFNSNDSRSLLQRDKGKRANQGLKDQMEKYKGKRSIAKEVMHRAFFNEANKGVKRTWSEIYGFRKSKPGDLLIWGTSGVNSDTYPAETPVIFTVGYKEEVLHICTNLYRVHDREALGKLLLAVEDIMEDPDNHKCGDGVGLCVGNLPKYQVKVCPLASNLLCAVYKDIKEAMKGLEYLDAQKTHHQWIFGVVQGVATLSVAKKKKP